MLRIVGGSARSRKLEAPEGLETRPTTDRVREALFNILTPRIAGADVLDLYAGSGAIAFEALSRGARSAVLVDAAPASERAMRANRDRLGMPDAHIVRMDVRAALTMLAQQGRRFDIVWLDPPYAAGLAQPTLEDVARLGLLAEGGIAILERGARTEPIAPAGLVCFDERKYGETRLCFYRMGEGNA